jgi:hypothetical protein
MVRRGELRFTADDAQRAWEVWGANCGPAAAAAMLGLTLDEIRPHLGLFESRRYTSPAMMFGLLRRVGAKWSTYYGADRWPAHGLVRVQWEGPWTQPGVPPPARYRHTHWIGAVTSGLGLGQVSIFDVNCMNVGGWVDLHTWSMRVVPWLLSQCEPDASGEWHITHAVEVAR